MGSGTPYVLCCLFLLSPHFIHKTTAETLIFCEEGKRPVDGFCVACTECPPGQGVTVNGLCDADQDTDCQPCIAGDTFSNISSATEVCHTCHTCNVGETLESPCTPNDDSHCICPADSFTSYNLECRRCDECTPVCGEGDYDEKCQSQTTTTAMTTPLTTVLSRNTHNWKTIGLAVGITAGGLLIVILILLYVFLYRKNYCNRGMLPENVRYQVANSEINLGIEENANKSHEEGGGAHCSDADNNVQDQVILGNAEDQDSDQGNNWLKNVSPNGQKCELFLSKISEKLSLKVSQLRVFHRNNGIPDTIVHNRIGDLDEMVKTNGFYDITYKVLDLWWKSDDTPKNAFELLNALKEVSPESGTVIKKIAAQFHKRETHF